MSMAQQSRVIRLHRMMTLAAAQNNQPKQSQLPSKQRVFQHRILPKPRSYAEQLLNPNQPQPTARDISRRIPKAEFDISDAALRAFDSRRWVSMIRRKPASKSGQVRQVNQQLEQRSQEFIITKEMLNNRFEPISSALSEELDDSKHQMHLSHAHHNGGFLGADDRLEVDKLLSVEHDPIEREKIIENYMDGIKESLISMGEHRSKHLTRVLMAQVPDFSRHPKILSQADKCFRVLTRYFCDFERNSVVSLQDIKGPKKTIVYWELLHKIPCRPTSYDIRSELNPTLLREYIAEVRSECQFNIYLLQRLKLQATTVWEARRIEQITTFERILETIACGAGETNVLSQVVKFSDELRRGMLMGLLGEDIMQNEQTQLLSDINRTVDQLEIIDPEDDHNIIIAISKLVKTLNSLKDKVYNGHVNIQIKNQLEQIIKQKQAIEDELNQWL